MGSPHTSARQWEEGVWDLTDPGDGGALPNASVGNVGLTVAASASETRTLAAPAKQFLMLAISLESLGSGGSVAITVTGGYDRSGTTSLTLDAANEYVVLVSVKVGGALRWRTLEDGFGT